MRRAWIFVLTALTLGALGGCANVQPWEKGNLAKAEMTFGDGGVFGRYDDHIYTSKENARGGSGVGGGGCGCN